MKRFLAFIFRIFSFLYPYKLHQRLIVCKKFFYTLWIKNFLGSIGDHSRLGYNCVLAGGGESGISIGDYTIIGNNTILACWKYFGNQQFASRIIIGNHCNIGEYNHITACNKIVIGDGLLTGRYVIISDNCHGGLSEEESSIEPAKRDLKSKGEVIIGNNVWIGDKVSILAGVHIGNNVVVGANSVVSKDLPDNCVAVGAPTRIVKMLGVN